MQSYFGFGIRTEFDRETFNILVPVKIPLNEIISGYEYFLIFWFYPTEEFITSLPEYIRYDLKSEFELIVKGTISTKSTCNYFEVCKSTLQVDNLKVYPNPANLSITIEFKSTEDMIGKISLVNISGKQIKLPGWGSA